MNKLTKKFLKYLKSVKLSKTEKDLLRYRISEFISFNPIRSDAHVPKKSFYFSIFTLRAIYKGVALVLIVLIVVGGTSVSYASTDALPGDALYPIKINIKENIEEKLALTKEAKVEVQSAKVERRLTEAKTLSDKKELSPANQKIVNENLKKNVEKVTKTIENLKDNGDFELALETTSKITPVLEAHREVLVENKDKEEREDKKVEEENSTNISLKQASTMAIMVEEPKEDSLIEAVDAAIKKVEEVETKVIEKATENKESADKITEKNTQSIEQKIEDIKKANFEEKKIEEKKISDEAKISEVKNSESMSLNSASTPSAETVTLKMEQKIVVSPEIIEKATAKIVVETDVEIRIRVAEELLKKADEEKLAGNYKEALRLSQLAKKIIQQIEEYRKIKALETKVEAEIVEQTETIQPTKVIPTTEANTATKVEVKTPTVVSPEKTELSTAELEAAAIKSLKETNESFKKLNFNQEAQTRLLQ